jgi:hypothetical protein
MAPLVLTAKAPLTTGWELNQRRLLILQSPGQMGRNRLWLISEQQHFKNAFGAWI